MEYHQEYFKPVYYVHLVYIVEELYDENAH
jgi:hypothetical protein